MLGGARANGIRAYDGRVSKQPLNKKVTFRSGAVDPGLTPETQYSLYVLVWQVEQINCSRQKKTGIYRPWSFTS